MSSAWAPTSPPVSRETIESIVSGDLTGQQIVGHHNIQVGSVHGGVVNLVVAQPPPSPSLRASVRRPPAPFPELVGRKEEVASALDALEAGGPVEVHAEAGMGKTALLCHLGNHTKAPFPELVVYCPGRRQPVNDLLQFIFEAFYDTGAVSFVPSFGQVSHYLRDVKAFVLIDDVDVDRADLQVLVQTVPQSAFLVTSEERRLWGPGTSFPLRGLPDAAAVELIETRIGRLDPADRPVAAAVAKACAGHPLRLIQAVQPVADGDRSLVDVADELGVRSSTQDAARRAIESLDPDRRALVGLLAALHDAPVHVDRAAEITGLANAPELLESLRRETGLAEAHSPRYSLSVPLGHELGQMVERGLWAERALRSLTTWVERNRRDPARLTPDVDAVLVILEWAASARRWAEVIRLGRGVEAAAAWHRRWGAWERIVALVQRAASAIGDRSAEAWCLHQLGVRALCLDDTVTAKAHLARALELRTSLGERDAALVTRFHLDDLSGPPPRPSSSPPEPPPPPRPTGMRIKVLGAAAVVLALVGALTAAVVRPSPSVLRISSPGGVAFEVEPARLDFGDRTVGATSPNQTVGVTNVGDRPLAIRDVRLEGEHAGDFAVQLDTCTGTTVIRSASCRLAVAFAPTVPGERRAGLRITVGSAATVTLIGSGTMAPGSPLAEAPAPGAEPPVTPVGPGPGPAGPSGTTATTAVPVLPTTRPTTTPEIVSVAADPTRIVFLPEDLILEGAGPPALPKAFAVQNRGSVPVRITSITVTGPQAGDFSVARCSDAVLPPDQQCVAQVVFDPESNPAFVPCPGNAPNVTVPGCRRYVAQVDVRTDRAAPLRVELVGWTPFGGID